MSFRTKSRFPLPSRSNRRVKRRFGPVLEAMESKLLLSTAQYLLDSSGHLYSEAAGVQTLVGSGVESFAVQGSVKGGQDVYWRTTGGNLYESISGGAARLLDVGVESFALADNAVRYRRPDAQRHPPGWVWR